MNTQKKGWETRRANKASKAANEIDPGNHTDNHMTGSNLALEKKRQTNEYRHDDFTCDHLNVRSKRRKIMNRSFAARQGTDPEPPKRDRPKPTMKPRYAIASDVGPNRDLILSHALTRMP